MVSMYYFFCLVVFLLIFGQEKIVSDKTSTRNQNFFKLSKLTYLKSTLKKLVVKKKMKQLFDLKKALPKIFFDSVSINWPS